MAFSSDDMRHMTSTRCVLSRLPAATAGLHVACYLSICCYLSVPSMVIIWLAVIVNYRVASFIRHIQTCLQRESGPHLEATPLFKVPTCGMQVWKKGNLMRVDGSLMGIDDKAGTLIPQWKRGHFSLLFDGRPLPATLLLVDHRKKTTVDLTKEKKKHQPDINDEVRPAAEELLSRHTIITLRGCRAP